MNLKQIETFVTVAEQGSFSKAADVLGIAQPALSRQVRHLEVELHEHLFARHGRGVELTEAGRRLLAYGRSILQLVEDARADVSASRQTPAGHVVIALPPSIARRLSIPLIQRFEANLPKVQLEIVEGFSSHMAEGIIGGQVSLGLLYNAQPHPSLALTPLFRERLCLIGRRGTLPPGPVRFAELPSYPLVVAQRGHIFRALMEAQALLHGVKLNVVWKVSSLPIVFDLLQAGHGYAVLTENALASHQPNGAPALESRLIQDPDIHCALFLAQREQSRDTVLVQRASAELTATLLAMQPRPVREPATPER